MTDPIDRVPETFKNEWEFKELEGSGDLISVENEIGSAALKQLQTDYGFIIFSVHEDVILLEIYDEARVVDNSDVNLEGLAYKLRKMRRNLYDEECEIMKAISGEK